MILGEIFGFLGKATGLIDELVTSDEERLQLKHGLMTIQAGVVAQALDYEKSLAEARSAIITQEAASGHWLTATWRPITMLTFLVIIVHAQFWPGAPPVPTEMWPLLKIGLGGYIIGRSAEKVVPATVTAFKAREEA